MELNKTFIDGLWSKEINVTSFVQTNITPYLGDASFLAGPTERTKHIWNLCLKALEEERQHNGVRALDNKTVSTVTSHKAGYIDRENELIVGLQTDELLKRAIKPFGGINVVSRACKENGVEVDEKVKDIFTHYRKTHNDGVFDVYTEEEPPHFSEFPQAVKIVFIAIIVALLGVIAFEGFQLFRGPTASESATQQKENDNQHLDINTLKGDPNDGDE